MSGAGNYMLCLVLHLEAKRFGFVFPKGQGLGKVGFFL